MQKNKDALLAELLNIKFGKNCKTYPAQIDFVLRTAFWAMNTSDNCTAEHTVHAMNGFTDYMNSQSDPEKFCSVLLLFSNDMHFKKSIPRIVGADSFDVYKWLRSITDTLMNAVNAADWSDDTTKSMYVKLTQVLVLYLTFEALESEGNEWKSDFVESRHFLAECMKCRRFDIERDQQYIECFRFYDQFVNGLTPSADYVSTVDATIQMLG